jgi:hypothetical protein
VSVIKGERYPVICQILRPFLAYLYRLIQASYNLRGDFEFSERAKMEPKMW